MYQEFFDQLRKIFKPYNDLPNFNELPKEGIDRQEIIQLLRKMLDKENEKWKKGFVSGAVYHGGEEHIQFLNEIYAISSQVNPLHPDIWPSVLKIEREIVEMASKILHGSEETCGSVTSGGTESILLSMKAYRDFAKKKKGINEPEIILPISAHAAFDKAANYFNIKLRYVNLNENFEANIEEIKEAINENTIAIVASAPCFPFGTIDPIEEISEIAYDKNIPFHVDACLGGFILPWARKLGYEIKKFDFELEGVTSISADLHKYGYSPKGCSLILYRNPEFWKCQFYINTKWSGGIYFSTTLAGSRAGALIIVAWATLLYLGESNYLKYTKQILEVADYIKSELKKIQDLKILGNPLWIIAVTCERLDIYEIIENMNELGWNLNVLMNPAAFHIAITLRHDLAVAKKFIEDLKLAMSKAKETKREGLAPIYGIMATLPKEESDEIVSYLIQWLYKDP
jgi:glutamate/tyrosine decarboxylase-like PLP-dependent enzyme